MIIKILLIFSCVLITSYLNMKLYRKIDNYIMKSKDHYSVMLIAPYFLSLTIQSLIVLGIGAFILSL